MRISDWSSDVCSSDLFEPPWIASLSREVIPCAIRCSAAARKSSKLFCLLARRPPSCHSLPYSPPPRMFATANTPPCSIHASRAVEKAGATGMLNPPRSEEHTAELQSLMRISYAAFCLKKKINQHHRCSLQLAKQNPNTP